MSSAGGASRNEILLVRVSPEFFRQVETHSRRGDASKAQRLLGWKAENQMDESCRIMVEKDIERLRAGELS